jgi:hypothetical protein
MKPETTGADLIAAVEQTLAKEVAPHLSGDARFKVLMAASALRMVMREMDAAARLNAAATALGGDDQAALVAALRSGHHDGDPLLHGQLLEDALARASISRPGVTR